MKVPITGDMSISEILLEYSCMERVFAAHGMACVGFMAAVEAIETGTQMHSVNIRRLLAELSQAIKAPEQAKLDELGSPS